MYTIYLLIYIMQVIKDDQARRAAELAERAGRRKARMNELLQKKKMLTKLLTKPARCRGAVENTSITPTSDIQGKEIARSSQQLQFPAERLWKLNESLSEISQKIFGDKRNPQELLLEFEAAEESCSKLFSSLSCVYLEIEDLSRQFKRAPESADTSTNAVTVITAKDAGFAINEVGHCVSLATDELKSLCHFVGEVSPAVSAAVSQGVSYEVPELLFYLSLLECWVLSALRSLGCNGALQKAQLPWLKRRSGNIKTKTL